MTRLNISANVESARSEKGTFFRMIDATGVVHTKFTDQGQPFPMTKGMSIKIPGGFDGVVFESDTTQTIEYVVMQDGEIRDDSFIPGTGSLSTIQGTETYGASTSVNLPVSASTSIVAAASGRKGVIIYNPDASQTIYLHNTAATTLSAIGIPPGGSLLLRSTQAWFGYNSSASTAIDVWVSEIT